MDPYRQPAPHPKDMSWCCVCRQDRLVVTSLRHPSGIGHVHVCIVCIDTLLNKPVVMQIDGDKVHFGEVNRWGSPRYKQVQIQLIFLQDNTIGLVSL